MNVCDPHSLHTLIYIIEKYIIIYYIITIILLNFIMIILNYNNNNYCNKYNYIIILFLHYPG